MWDLGNILLGLAKYSSGVGKILKCGIWEICYWGWQNIAVGLGKN